MSRSFNLRQRGISLLEVLLSVAIISSILITATQYFLKARKDQAINHAVSEIASVMGALQDWDGGTNNFSGLSSDAILNLYNAGFLPDTTDLQLTPTTGTPTSAKLMNPWGNEITVVGTTNSATISTQLMSVADCSAVKSNFVSSSCDDDNNFTCTLQ